MTLIDTTAEPVVGAPVKPGLKRQRRQTAVGYVFMTPWVLGFVLIVGGPVLFSLYYSFTDYNLLGSPEWVGLENYRQMFTEDPRFRSRSKGHRSPTSLSRCRSSRALRCCSRWSLNRGIRGLTIYRTLFYIPSLIGGSVAIAILWRFIFSADGLFNNVLGRLRCGHRRLLDRHPDTALYTLVALNVWQFGAADDHLSSPGSSRSRPSSTRPPRSTAPSRSPPVLSITLPMLSPVIFFNVLMNIVGAFQAFNTAYIVSNGTRRPRRLDALLHALPLPARLRRLPHGLRVRPRLGAADHRRRRRRRAVQPQPPARLLRRRVMATPWSAPPASSTAGAPRSPMRHARC